MYDKQGRVLRVETTINNPRRLYVYRRRRQRGRVRNDWLPLRKGMADLRCRHQVARAANASYLNALSVVGEPSGAPRCWTPFPTRSGCAAAAIGRCAPSAHVTAAWNPPPNADASTQRRISAQIGRFLRLCRAHGLLRKVHGTATASLTRATCS